MRIKILMSGVKMRFYSKVVFLCQWTGCPDSTADATDAAETTVGTTTDDHAEWSRSVWLWPASNGKWLDAITTTNVISTATASSVCHYWTSATQHELWRFSNGNHARLRPNP